MEVLGKHRSPVGRAVGCPSGQDAWGWEQAVGTGSEMGGKGGDTESVLTGAGVAEVSAVGQALHWVTRSPLLRLIYGCAHKGLES